MRLLNTSTLQLHDFVSANVPSYTILSHRWGDYEVSYKDWKKHRAPESPSKAKILSFCRVAQAHGRDWVWVDSICIDKSSSAELSEAINSMWKWYRGSEDCYVYLSDVPSRAETEGDYDSMKAFRESTWFSRGWTLQELLAPSNVIFFTQAWGIIGYKHGDTMAHELSEVTRIPVQYLCSATSVQSASVAQRMSWAASRRTTRVEDMAYCLLGLFDVNMPLLYGEGQRAFMRLQQEILKKSSDESLFAWRQPQVDALYRTGMLAPWPSVFKDSGRIVASGFDEFAIPRPPYQMTNKGLEFRATAKKIGEYDDKAYIVALNCWEPRGSIDGSGEETMKQCAIVLTRPLGMRIANTDLAERMNCRELGEELRHNYPLESRTEVGGMLFYIHQPGL